MPTTLNIQELTECCAFPHDELGRYVNACIVNLDGAGHASGVEFHVVHGVKNKDYNLAWAKCVDAPMRRAHRDSVRAVEDGAIALAWLAVNELHGHVVISESVRKDGYDYHLSSNNANNDGLDLSGPRLEVSGIQQERGSNTVASRVKDKRNRLKQKSHPTYIFVAEFATPKGVLEYVS